MSGVAIKLNKDLVTSARKVGKVENRSAPRQVEYWAKIGRIAIDNSDLTFEDIHNILVGRSQIERGETEPYVFGEGD